MAMGYEFVPGMKVSWIVTNSRKTPQEIAPYVYGRKFDAVPDWMYYAGRLAQSVARATENFGWTENDLMTGSQQSDLFSQNFHDDGDKKDKEESKPKGKDGVRKTDQKLNLDHFM
jgi:DNA polymerase I